MNWRGEGDGKREKRHSRATEYFEIDDEVLP